MVGILDLLPKVEGVQIDDKQTLEVKGLSAKGIAYLLTRFPFLLKAISGEGIDLNAIFAEGPDSVGPIIAASCGYVPREHDDGWNAKCKEAEESASALDITTQMACLEAMARVTFKGGLRPFVERWRWITEQCMEQASAIQAMRSQKPSSNSGHMPTPPSGTSPPAN